MPTAPVDANGSLLYYEDTGAPEGSTDYVTLILIHGTCFHSAVYRPMTPLATGRNLRLVLVNLRDYPGSTPYPVEPEDELRGTSEEAQDRVWYTAGLEVAAFLRWFIETENIPPIKEGAGSDTLKGGLSLLSWSGGNRSTIAMLAYADRIPEHIRKLFDQYLRSFIMFEPSSITFGYPLPPGLATLPETNPSDPLDVRVAEFALAVASYYPPFTLPDSVEPLHTYEPPRYPMHQSTDSVNPKHLPTTSKMSPEVLRSVTYPPVMQPSPNQKLVSAISSETRLAAIERALFDCRFDHGNGTLEKVWPALRVHLIWCDMTLGECAWAAAMIHAGHKAANPEHRRPLKIHKIEGANDFVHWEEPERFLTLLASIV